MLEAARPTDLMAVVERLTALPVEPTRAIAPSYDLVCWSRLGSAYEPEDLDDLLADRDLYEDADGIRPMADLALHLADMAAWPPWDGTRDWLEANELFRNEVLDVLDADGPLPSRDVHATAQVPWKSSGWNVRPQRPHDALLPAGPRRGSGERPRRHPEEVRPRRAGLPDRASRLCRARRPWRSATSAGCRGLGIARAKGTVLPGEPIHVGRRRRARGGRGHRRRVAGRPRPARSAVRGTHGAALAVRPGDPRPGADGGPVRVRVRPRDVQAGGDSAAGATSRCRSCTATAWSGSSTPPPTARPAGSSSTPSTRTCRSRRP